MKITKKTKVKEILPFLTEERFNKLLEAVEEYPLDKNILSFSIGEFADLTIDEESYIKKILNPKEKVYIAFGKLKSYRNQMKQLADYLKTFELKLTPEEKQASQGIDLPSTVERILLDTVKAYHLHSTKEAEELPLTDWILFLKDSVATARYSRNYNKILEQKAKAHRKK